MEENLLHLFFLIFNVYYQYMKITYSSTKSDFFIFYFSQVFLKKPTYFDYIYDFASVFNVHREKIRSLEISDKQKIKLFNGEDLNDFKDYHFIYDHFLGIDKNKMDFIINNLNEKSNNLFKFLNNIFGESILPPETHISFIQSPIKNAKTDYNAFTSKKIKEKIFFNFDNNIDINNIDEINNYIKILLHELTHTFINHNNHFQSIMKNEWIRKYKESGINIADYRLNTEELIVSTLIFPAKDIGFAFKFLDYSENEEKKKDSLEKNRFRKFALDFLYNLEKGNYLEKELPLLLENLINNGMFKI